MTVVSHHGKSILGFPIRADAPAARMTTPTGLFCFSASMNAWTVFVHVDVQRLTRDEFRFK
jgi:hypothetical protein